MKTLAIILGAAALYFGVRLLLIAGRIAFSGQILVRNGTKSQWQPAPSSDYVWKMAFKEGLMGLLFVILGVALIT